MKKLNKLLIFILATILVLGFRVQAANKYSPKVLKANEKNAVDVANIGLGLVAPTETKVDVTGNVKWLLGPKIKPTIQLQLYRDNLAYGDPVELVDGETSYTWNKLEKTNNAGIHYIYTIDEVSVPENYDKVISEDGLTVTNAYYELSTDYISEELENVATNYSTEIQAFKLPHTKSNNFAPLFTIIVMLSSGALLVILKRKEKNIKNKK